MVHMLSGAIPLYIVNEYPKSGGTWVGQMLGRALRVPFPRNRFPVLRPSIMHGHYLRPWGMKNVVVVWRDGRDVMVSWYHQNLFSHEWRNDLQVERARREFSFRNYDDIYKNLPEFIEWAFTQKGALHASRGPIPASRGRTSCAAGVTVRTWSTCVTRTCAGRPSAGCRGSSWS